jgi:hypothetical protein
MSTQTTNLQLAKPLENEFYDINIINANMDKIDAGVASRETPTGAQDKVDTHANAADPHTGYIKKSLATTANDFIVASGAGVFVKKTLAEVKAILGLGSAAYTASTAYATATQGTKADNAATQASVDTHLADYVRQAGYGTTAGVASTYTLTLSPALTSYTAGVGVTVKINIANTGASTINVNGLGAKSILDSKGNAMTTGKLRLNGVYTLRYDGTNFILQGEGGSGNAVASDLLSGKTASTDAGDVVGTMPNMSVGDKLSSGATGVAGRIYMAMPTGYVADNGLYFDDAEFIAANWPANINLFGLQGTMPNRGSYQVSTAIMNQTMVIPQGYHDGTGYIWYWDANHIATNIKKDVNIGGVVGTHNQMETLVAGATKVLNSTAINASAQTIHIADTTSTTLVPVNASYTMQIGGSIRVRFCIRSNTSSYSAYGQIHVNGVVRGALCYTSNSNPGEWFTEDITVNAGDVVAIYLRRSTSATRCYLMAVELCANAGAPVLSDAHVNS